MGVADPVDAHIRLDQPASSLHTNRSSKHFVWALVCTAKHRLSNINNSLTESGKTWARLSNFYIE